jgi:exoribonuclease R
LRDIPDDYYFFDEESYSIIGKESKKRYRLGDEVTITVKRADLVKKQLDFALLDERPRRINRDAVVREPKKRNRYKR